MRVTIFSSNQPRHLNLAREFEQFTDTVFFVSEVKQPFCSLEDAIVAQKIAESARKSSILERVINLDEFSL